jgi:ribosomal protein L19
MFECLRVGGVYKLYYFSVINLKRKIFNFVGICVSLRKKNNTFELRNYQNNLNIKMTFLEFSPVILKIEELKSYNFRFERNKLYKVKNFNFRNDDPLVLKKNYDVSYYEHMIKLEHAVGISRKKFRDKFRI